MSEIQQWQLIIGICALFVGGLGGAIFTYFATSYRNRVQPIGHSIDVIPILKPNEDKTKLNTKIVVEDEIDGQHEFRNLFLYDVLLINKSNQDIRDFTIGVTLQNGDKAIYADVETPDRHHTAISTKVTPENPLSEIDFTLSPFNRGKAYSLKVYVVIPDGSSNPSEIDLSSPHSIKFTPIRGLPELVAEAIAGTSVNLAGIRLTIPKF